jgi:3,4-dihydroxy 2-butanone 4-phosphate synthase/GTP cyclohydrolase II
MAAKKITGKFDSIEAVLRDIACGKMVVVVDDADRENEGDLIMAAEKTTAKAVNFMARFGRGLICVPTAPERLQQLGIERMVLNNREGHRTDFQISVDAAQGITTGISAADRDRTIKTLANPTSIADDLVQPGHVFPLRAKTGGVLQRAGHTEAAVDLARLAGCRPMGVICEVMNDDGSMARLPELRRFAKKHKLRLCSIEQLIEFRRKREKLVACEEIVHMPTDFGEFDLHLYRSTIDGQHHLALVKGSMSARRRTLVRVHSECLTGDVFGSRRCDCGPQLQQAMKQVSAPATVQRERVLARAGMTEAKFADILALQTPDAEKRDRADHIVDTGVSIEETEAEVLALIERLKAVSDPL